MKKIILVSILSIFLAGCSMFDTGTPDHITPQRIFSGAQNAKQKQLQNVKELNKMNNIDK